MSSTAIPSISGTCRRPRLPDCSPQHKEDDDDVDDDVARPTFMVVVVDFAGTAALLSVYVS